MKVVLNDICYKGIHIDKYECDLPQITNLDEVPEEKITEYITESLDTYLKDQKADSK